MSMRPQVLGPVGGLAFGFGLMLLLQQSGVLLLTGVTAFLVPALIAGVAFGGVRWAQRRQPAGTASEDNAADSDGEAEADGDGDGGGGEAPEVTP